MRGSAVVDVTAHAEVTCQALDLGARTHPAHGPAGLQAREGVGAARTDSGEGRGVHGPAQPDRRGAAVAAQLARDLGVRGHIYYGAPARGFTYTQSLLAHTAGASAVRGEVQVFGSDDVEAVDRGDIVELSVGGPEWRERVRWLCDRLRARNLTIVPADDLLRRKA